MTSMILKSAVFTAALVLAMPAFAQTGSGGTGGAAGGAGVGSPGTAGGAGAGAGAGAAGNTGADGAAGTVNRPGDPSTTGTVQDGPRNASCVTVMANRANYPAAVVDRCQGK